MTPRSLTVRLLAAALPLSLAACSGGTSFEGPSQANPLDTEEVDIVVALNNARSKAGAASVGVCTSLDKSASAHSDDMRDKMYLSDVAPDGSTVRTRGCSAGYSAACNGATVAMAELVASGNATAKETFAQWAGDPTSSPLLTNASFLVVGVGRSLSDNDALWTLDFGAVDDPSCK